MISLMPQKQPWVEQIRGKAQTLPGHSTEASLPRPLNLPRRDRGTDFSRVPQERRDARANKQEGTRSRAGKSSTGQGRRQTPGVGPEQNQARWGRRSTPRRQDSRQPDVSGPLEEIAVLMVDSLGRIHDKLMES